MTVRFKERLRRPDSACAGTCQQSYCGSEAAQPSIGGVAITCPTATTLETPFQMKSRAWIGAGQALPVRPRERESFATFAPDPVRLAIGNFVKAWRLPDRGALPRCLGQPCLAAFVPPHDLLGFYEIGSAMARTGLNPQEVRWRGAWHRIPCMIRFFSIFGGIRRKVQLPTRP